MVIQLTISTAKTVKHGEFGSIRAEAGISVELVTPATASDTEIQREIRHHYETITGAVFAQLRDLQGRQLDSPPPPATPKSAANGKPNGQPTTARPAAPAAPAAPATIATPKPNGTTKATAAPAPTPAATRPTPPQPAAQRIALDAELTRQFAPRAPEPDDDLADDEEPLPGEIVTPEDDQDDDTPHSGIELLGWARHQPGDAKQELAAIGMHLRHPALILNWTPEQVAKAYAIYRRTSSD